MDDRQQTWTCSAHHEVMQDINRKLDGIIDRQIDYIKTTAEIKAKQEHLESIVTNGLSDTVSNMAKGFADFREEVKVRFEKLEEFKWFRVPITNLRDKLFWYALKIALAGGAIYLLISYSGDIIKRTLS